MALIAAAAQNGAVNPESLEKLMDLQERWESNNAKKEFNQAFASFQSSMPAIAKDRKGSKSKYADYADIMKKARPILVKNGLSLSFDQRETDGAIEIKVNLLHIGGHKQETRFTLPKDGPLQTKDGRSITNAAQAQGSANSYAKRYAVCNALDIVLIGEDDDAEALSGEIISAEQAQELREILNKAGANESKFLAWAGADTFEQILLEKFPLAKGTLEKALRKAQAAGGDQ